MRVLFVCTGNVCRSPMAQVIFENIAKRENRKDIVVASAGVMTINGLPMTPTARVALGNCGQKLGRKKRVSTLFNQGMLGKFDHIVCMTQKHAEVIGVHPNVYTLDSVCGGGDVYDPFMQGEDVYTAVCGELVVALEKLYEVIGGVG